LDVGVSKSSALKRKRLSSESDNDQEAMEEEQTSVFLLSLSVCVCANFSLLNDILNFFFSGSDVEDFDIGEFETEDIYNEDKLMKEAILRSSSEIKIRFLCLTFDFIVFLLLHESRVTFRLHFIVL
jgi:hypothetical protein